MIFAWSETELDQSPRVGHGLALPTVVRLIFAHGFFARLVPATAGLFFRQVMFANQGLLDFLRTLRINLLLATRAA